MTKSAFFYSHLVKIRFAKISQNHRYFFLTYFFLFKRNSSFCFYLYFCDVKRLRKKIAPFFYRYIFTNLLALFLIGLSVAEGEEAVHQFPPSGIHLDVSDFDYVDFPTSLSRTTSGNQQSREIGLPLFYLRYNPFHLLLLLTAATPEIFPPFFTLDQIRQNSIPVCHGTNAP